MTVFASQPSVSIETDTTQRVPPPSLPLAADGVHDLAQEVLVGELLGGLAVAGALHDLAPELLDLPLRHLSEVVVERLARLELRAVDQERVRPRERVSVVVEVPK